MNFKIKQKQKPKIGDKRQVLKFAWLPTKVRDIKDENEYWVWLENYLVEQWFEGSYDGISGVDVEGWLTVHKFKNI